MARSIPLAGGTATLAEIEALYAIRVAEILRERQGGFTPRAKLSDKTRRQYSWHLTVTSRIAHELERRGLVEVRLIGTPVSDYQNFAYLTEAGRKALASRDEALTSQADAVQCNDAAANRGLGVVRPSKVQA